MAPYNKLIAGALLGRHHLEAVDQVASERMEGLDATRAIVYLFGSVEDAALESLARQFNTDGIKGFDFADSDDDRRELLRRTIRRSKIKGTPASIRDILVASGYTGADFIERFGIYADGSAFCDGSIQAGGEEFNWTQFTIVIDTDEKELDLTEIRKLVTEFKPARSALVYTAAGPAYDGVDDESVPETAVVLVDGDFYEMYNYQGTQITGEGSDTISVDGTEYEFEYIEYEFEE